MFAEVGPLTMDEKVYSDAQSYIKKLERERTFDVAITNSNIGHLNKQSLPLK
jgi:hypothetical protein